MADSNAISSLALNFDASLISRRRRIRLEQAHLMDPWTKLYELF